MENSENTLVDRDLWERLFKSQKTGDREGFMRIVQDELLGSEEAKNAFREMAESLIETRRRVLDGKQQPNLARCILALINELKDIELWDGEGNSTYDLASKVLEEYARAEKKRVQYLATKDAYNVAQMEYLIEMIGLATNLACKTLYPLTGNSGDPLKWYLPTTKIIEACKNSGVELTLPTLRKYQGLGLVPKPIRLGRQGHYSLLTVLRVVLINTLKQHGYKLVDVKKVINKGLRNYLGEYEEIFPGDRNFLEDACARMPGLVNKSRDDFIQESFGKMMRGLRNKLKEALSAKIRK